MGIAELKHKESATGPLLHNTGKDLDLQMDLLETAASQPEAKPAAPVKPSMNSQIVHYFDGNGALRSGWFVKWGEEGEQKGKVVVSDYQGNHIIPEKIRNIE